MSYVKESLMSDEKVIFEARVHLAVFLPAILLFVGFVVVFALSYITVAA